MEVGPCCLTGAPSIASAAGAFVAGNATGAPAPTKLHEGYPHPPSFDSAWRMEASNSLELPVFHPVPEIPFQGGEPGEAQPSCERNVIDLDDDEIGATQNMRLRKREPMTFPWDIHQVPLLRRLLTLRQRRQRIQRMKSWRISLTNITTRVSVACVHVYIVELFAGLRCTYMT